jgi:hypothetical protein
MAYAALVHVHHHGPLEVSDGAGDHHRRAGWRCLGLVWLAADPADLPLNWHCRSSGLC